MEDYTLVDFLCTWIEGEEMDTDEVDSESGDDNHAGSSSTEEVVDDAKVSASKEQSSTVEAKC